MKISAVETTMVRLPFSHGGPPTGFGGVAWGSIDTLLVEIKTDDGLSGWGEAFGFNVSPATKVTIDTMIAPLLIGADAEAIDEIGDTLQRKLHLFGRNGPVVYGISGIDIALWDLAGKVSGLPLCQLLLERSGQSGPPLGEIATYASLLRYGTPQWVVHNARRALSDGYRAIKLHETNIETIAAARACIGADIPLMVDTNCSWSLEDAQEQVCGLRHLGLYWLEEPVWPPEDAAALAQLRAARMVPVAAGENTGNVVDFKRLLDTQAVDFIQPSVIKCGGISAMCSIIELARKAQVQIAPHSPYFGPGFLATLHLNAALARESHVERLYVDLQETLYGSLFNPKEGRIAVPTRAGLGFDPDLEIIARYRA